MPSSKSFTTGTVRLTDTASFVAGALPDPFDDRDYEYRPALDLLPDEQYLPPNPYVMSQEGNSCVGHALAACINAALAHAAAAGRLKGGVANQRVSPYMLYYLARRYDEFEGDTDAGSSIRGALKGWSHHGVCIGAEWRNLQRIRDLEDDTFREHCGERPLGAYYRVNPVRLDDMQSAITELRAVAASASIHDGWETPVPDPDSEQLPVIHRGSGDRGGHAFAIVGYNRQGFVLQNSWGADWGRDGFAILPYDDWLENAYDAWVVRPGVPHTPMARVRRGVGGAPGIPAPAGHARDDLRAHVINCSNGRLSKSGEFMSTPWQIERIFSHMAEKHDEWADDGSPRNLVIYAHGGMVGERGGLSGAARMMPWWMANRIYPIHFAWETGVPETILDVLGNALRDRLPAGGLTDLWRDAVDRLGEFMASKPLSRATWADMKANACAASSALPVTLELDWTNIDATAAEMEKSPAASLLVDRLRGYIETRVNDPVKVHLVGHSAGSIFHAALLDRLAEYGIPVESVSFLAPAIRIDEFEEHVAPHLEANRIARMVMFVLSAERELGDACRVGPVNLYNKSILWLLARAVERRDADGTQIPILGMMEFLQDRDGPGFARRLKQLGVDLAVAPADAPGALLRTNAQAHGAFDDDEDTLNSVMGYITGGTLLVPYRRNIGVEAQPPAAVNAPPAGTSTIGQRASIAAAQWDPRATIHWESRSNPRTI